MSQIHLSYKLDLAPESTWLTVNPTATAKSNLIYVQEPVSYTHLTLPTN